MARPTDVTAAAGSAASGHYPPARFAWTALAILVATTVLSYTDRQVLTLLVRPLRSDLALTDTEFGLLVGTAFALLYGLAGLPFGYLADRRSRRLLILAGVTLWSAGTVGCAFAGSFWQLFAGRMVVGIGEAALTPAAISLISDLFPPRLRGTATGVFLMGIAMGAGGAIFFGGLVLKAVEGGLFAGTGLAGLAAWRLVLLLLGALGVLPVVLLLALREPVRQRDAVACASDAPAPVRWRPLVPLLIGIALVSLVDNAVLAWAPSVLIGDQGIPAARVGVVLGALLIVAGSVGVLAGGVLGDRARAARGRRGQLALCLLLACLIAPLAALLGIGSAIAVYGAVALYIGLSGAASAAGIAALLDGVGNAQRGVVTAVSFFLNVAFGAGVGPPAVALVRAQLPGPAPDLATAIAIVWAVGFGLVAWAFRTSLVEQARSEVPAQR